MFDLFRSRDKLVRYMLGGLLVIVAASMVTYLIPGFATNTGTPSATVFEVGDHNYTVQDVQQGFQRLVQGQHSIKSSEETGDVMLGELLDSEWRHAAERDDALVVRPDLGQGGG